LPFRSIATALPQGGRNCSGWFWPAAHMDRLFLSKNKPFWSVNRMSAWEPDEPAIFDRCSFVVLSLLSETQPRGFIGTSETEVTIDSVQKKPRCGARRDRRSSVLPRSGHSNETEPGRSWLHARSQDLPTAPRPFALCWFASVPKLPRGHAY